MEQMNLFGKEPKVDELPVSGKFLEDLYRIVSDFAYEYVASLGRFPGAVAILPWLLRYGNAYDVSLTEEQLLTLDSLNLKEKKQIADTLAKAFCGEIFLLPDEKKWAEILKEDGMRLEGLPSEKQTPPLCLVAVRQNGLALKYVSWKLDMVVEAALAQNGLAFQFISQIVTGHKYYTYDTLRYYALRAQALAQNGLALQYVEDQEPYECFLAIRQNPEAATFVTNEEVLAKCHGDLTFLVNHLDEISVEIYSKNR